MAASVALACAVTGGNAWAGTTGTTPPAAGKASHVAAVSTITLVTGDRVRVSTRTDGTQDAALIPGSDGRVPGASVYRHGKDLYVVPFEALPYLRAGKVDRALFDVTQLVTSGLGDDKAGSLKLMVSSPSSPLSSTPSAGTSAKASSSAKAATAPPAPPDSTATVTVPGLGLTGVRVDKRRARAFWQAIDTAPAAGGTAAPAFGAGVGKLWLDRKVKVSLDRSVPQIGAPAAYAAGLDGTGVKVAVVDTGIDNENADVSPKVVAEKNFTAEKTTDDPFGHGTHVASIVAGSGANSNGKYKGVAPGASLIDARVLDSTGSGDDSTVLAGMQWAAGEQGAQVINMSLGGGPTDGTDPLALAVNDLTQQYGSLFVIAAGNSGSDESVNSPGTADAALTVGAVDRSDALADFSSRGPRRGDGAIKPEITAPGVDIVAAQADGTALGPVVAPNYVALSGTSMATPHVAGSAALLKEQHPGWTPAQLKAGLVSTAKPTAGTPVWSQGVGRVDVASAIATGGLAVDQGTLSLGLNLWPHGNHPVQTRTLTYTNTGSAATTLTLAAALADDQGTALPAGVLTMTPTTLPLAAGATGTVTVTLDPNKAGVGRWSGLVTATSTGGTVLRTAAGFINETEHYAVTVTVLDRQGKPTTSADITLFNPTTGEYHSSWDLTDPAKPTFRISPGTWFAAAAITPDATSTAFETTFAVQPEVSISSTRTITLDGSTARPVSVSTTDKDVTSVLSQVNVLRTGDAGIGGTGMAAIGGGMTFYATPTAKVSTGGLVLEAADSLRVPAIAATVASSGTVLHPELISDDTRLDGTRTLQVAKSSGNVKGKLALLGVTTEGPLDAELTRLAKAGATAVAVYPATPDAAIWLDAAPALPTLYLPPAEGETLAALLAKGTVKVTLVGAYYSPKVYDLAHDWTGQIPARATVRYGVADLARIDETYRDSGTHAPTQEAVIPELVGGAWAMFVQTRPGSTRTSYVSTQLPVSQALWYGAVVDPQGFINPLVEWDSDVAGYRSGQRAALTWAQQVAKPGLPTTDPYGLTGRSGDDAYAYLSPWTDGQGRVSWLMGTDAGAWKLSARGSAIASGTGPAMQATLPAKRQQYTLDFTDRIDNPQWNRSTSTTTQWTFSSAHVEPTAQGTLPPQLPLLTVDLPLPLDASNSAAAGSTMAFQVTGRFPAGVPTAKVSALTVQISADGGKTWTPATVKRVDADTFGVTITNPRSKGPVSVRIVATAQDGAGIRQEVTAAYALK